MDKRYSGFSILEVLIVIAILFVLSILLLWSWSNFKVKKEVGNAVGVVYSVLNEARSKTTSGLDESIYGVNFDNDSVFLFKDNTSNVLESFDLGLNITINFNPSGEDVFFNRLSGRPNRSGLITLEKKGFEGYVNIEQSGIISINE